MGGAYGGRDITIDIAVDNTLCDNLFFEDGTPVLPMPSTYYTLAGDKISYNGEHWGNVEVQLTDAFFADEKALGCNYVIPVVMKGQTGADRILTGTPLIEGDKPVRTNSDYWSVLPKDYVLYCVKYMNPWHASYLRRGIDKITENGTVTTSERHAQSVEKDEVCGITTRSLNTAVFPISTTSTNGTTVNCDLLLTFNDDNECTITSGTTGVSATGSGKFVEDGEKKIEDTASGDSSEEQNQISKDVIPLSSIEITSKVNTEKKGIYTVNYRYTSEETGYDCNANLIVVVE